VFSRFQKTHPFTCGGRANGSSAVHQFARYANAHFIMILPNGTDLLAPRWSAGRDCSMQSMPIGRMSVRRNWLALALFLAALAPASAAVRIRSSGGVEVGTYLPLFELVRKSGQRVIIDGPCLSACTLALSIVPHRRICMTPRAVLGFHAAV